MNCWCSRLFSCNSFCTLDFWTISLVTCLGLVAAPAALNYVILHFCRHLGDTKTRSGAVPCARTQSYCAMVCRSNAVFYFDFTSRTGLCSAEDDGSRDRASPSTDSIDKDTIQGNVRSCYSTHSGKVTDWFGDRQGDRGPVSVNFSDCRSGVCVKRLSAGARFVVLGLHRTAE